MESRVTEVAPDTYQLSSFVGAPVGFNQYLVAAEEPLLFHTGMRATFGAVSAGVGSVLPVESLRWVSFGHVEADESGSLNEWLAVAPHATPVQGQIGCMVSVEDLADRAPRPLAHGETLDIGGHVVQWFDTPHVPHAWEAGVLYDVTAKTLFCGDLFTRFGEFEATSDDDIVGPAVEAEDMAPGGLSLHPASGRIIRELAELDVQTLALMHGPAFSGDCRAALLALADDVDARIARLSN
ncbi:MBL fold metallo-hydrolase [Rhabdothermincola salaria]|uniref:MBL fold metallo-hydrolase n=1 Tax=Rhabdothermincola salaria TaxID=2903142 RepID=UPI001E2F8F5B|nr:MBL fold metallo-hydrolase [Rhabdothermincola salaria]MCD9623922.1 MBL fold metallo-hydrolase [Rhabdothermincola salaria]